MSWQSRASAGDRQRLYDGGEKLERVCESRRRSDIRLCVQARHENRNRNTDKRIRSERDRFIKEPIPFWRSKEKAQFEQRSAPPRQLTNTTPQTAIVCGF